MQTQSKNATTTELPTRSRLKITVDGNEAAALVAYKCNEVIAIYPITPSSPMAELADSWAASGKPNLWGCIPVIQEMQSEGGAAGAAHGALLSGALTTSFTASQGLLLMIPNMFKLAGELTSAVFHVTARSVATHGLSIFCDHSDVMATRSTGWGMMFANSVQEAHDFALITQAISLKSRIPFLNIFDGFRTSHEVAKIEALDDDDIRAMIDEPMVNEHRLRGLSPARPSIRGTAQNPDIFFQSRERSNLHYDAAPDIALEMMGRFAELTGRTYKPFDFHGVADAERVVVVMGSASETLKQTADWLNAHGEKVGVVSVHLYRPFSQNLLCQALPPSTKVLAVLDRTKEPGSAGEPLLQDVVNSVFESERKLKIIGGRYGLGSKEFTPAMAKSVFDEMKKNEPKRRFTVGILDDVTNLSLSYDDNFNVDSAGTVQAIFWGLGADGTVGANKNSIKIIGEETNNFAQGFFVYDSKKSGSMTVSHLRFGPNEINSPYLIEKANFIGIHQFGFIGQYPVLATAAENATVLINCAFAGNEAWQHLPEEMQEQIRSKNLKVYVLDAYRVAKEQGLGNRINTIMQVGFFALSGVLEHDEAIAQIKKAIKKSYGKFGEPVVKQNFAAVDSTLAHLEEMIIPKTTSASRGAAESCDHGCPGCGPATAASGCITEPCGPGCPGCASGSCQSSHAGAEANFNGHDCARSCPAQLCTQVTMELIAGRGDALAVSAMPLDGCFPTDTARLEKRNIATEIPVWDPSVCIQCGKCVMVCPHAVIRSKLITPADLASSPSTFKTQPSSWKEHKDKKFSIQISAEDCTGCAMCVEVCPAKNKSAVGRKALNMVEKNETSIADERKNWNYFLSLPELSDTELPQSHSIKNTQLLQPLFEFSGACAGCGETPYLKLLSQLFGERALIANATGCSSIYGGNLPTTPWSKTKAGTGPAWANSLFEDNAEFGLGMRLAVDIQLERARHLLNSLRNEIGSELADAILQAEQSSDEDLRAQKLRIEELKTMLAKQASPEAKDLLAMVDIFERRSVWLVGGDGWAYDIGYGGLDHVLASGKNVNILVLDTEVYSNTGGQMSKATARGAVAKFAAGGKDNAKKDLARLALSYGNVYVARVAMGASDTQTLNAFVEAEAYDGPSLIIAYSHCIAHGINMSKGMNQQRLAVASGHWPLFRFDPRKNTAGHNGFHLDCAEPSVPLEEYYYSETRYKMLKQKAPEQAARLIALAKKDISATWQAYKALQHENDQNTSNSATHTE